MIHLLRSAAAGSSLLLAAGATAQPDISFGPLSPQVASGSYRFATQVRAADVTGDGLIDAVITDMEGQWPPHARRFTLYRNLGGGFASGVSTIIAGGPYPQTHLAQPALALADFDEDGRADLATSQQINSGQNSPNLALLFGNADGSFGRQVNLRTSTTDQYMASIIAQGVAAGDVNGDGHADLVSTAAFARLAVLRGDGSGAFADATATGQATTGSHVVLLGDVDGNGDVDAVTVTRVGSGSTAASNVEVNLGDGLGAFAFAGSFVIDGNISVGDGRRVVLGRFDADARVDMAVLAFPGSQRGVGGVYVFRAVGAGQFELVQRRTPAELPNIVDLAAADFNGDGVDDLVLVPNALADEGRVWAFDAGGGFVDAAFPTTSAGYVAMAAPAGVAGSPLPDLVFSDTPGHTETPAAGLRWMENVSAFAPLCDPDVNTDGNVDQNDVGCIIDIIAGNPGCSSQDADFNRDGNVDQEDVAAVINAVAGGGCP